MCPGLFRRPDIDSVSPCSDDALDRAWSVDRGHGHDIEEAKMTNLTKKLTVVLAAIFLSFAIAACEEQGTAEKAGEAIDEAAEKAAETVEEGAEQAEQIAEDAAEKVEEAAEEVQKNAE